MYSVYDFPKDMRARLGSRTDLHVPINRSRRNQNIALCHLACLHRSFKRLEVLGAPNCGYRW